jgi:RNA polymerase sigma factor for flagellar operon FliA
MNAPSRLAVPQAHTRFGRADPVADRVRAHLPLVRRIAWHVHGRAPGAVEIEELVQTGMVALVEAAQGYEDRGHAFATYAQMRVRGSMIDLIRRNATICRSAIARKRQIEAARRSLGVELGRAPDEAELAAAMGVPASEWRAMVDATETVRHESIDEVYSEHSMWFADEAEGADELLDRKDMQARLAAAIAQLPEREGQVLQLYFVEELNLDEIGETLGVGAARVCQIKKAALDRVRGMLSGADD